MNAEGVGRRRRGFNYVLATLVALHACMASTRIAASLAVLHEGYPEWTVGALLSLYALAPIDHIGFRAAFAFGALLPLLAAWAAWQVPRVASAPHPSVAALPGGGAIGLLRIARLRDLMWVNVAMAAAWDSHLFAVPVIGNSRELSASAIGVVLSAFAIASTAVRVVILTLGRHVAEPRALSAAITLATGALLAYAWLPGTLGMILGSAVLGVALGSVQPMVLSMLHQSVPPDRQGQALALRMLFTNTATIAMPVLFGLLATATTSAAPMWLMAALLVAARWPARRLGVSGSLEADPGRV